jgi:hypothetical protein
MDTDEDSGDVRLDVPIDFERRIFAPRRVKTIFIPMHELPRRSS